MIDKSDFKAVLLFNHRFFKVYTVGLGSEKSVPSGSYTVRSRRSSLNERGERLFTLILDSAADAADAATLLLRAAESYAAVGRSTDAEGILFTPEEAEELHVLLPAGSMVTIVD